MKFFKKIAASSLVLASTFTAKADTDFTPLCERTQQVQDFIVQRISQIQKESLTCADINADDIADLERVSVAFTGVKSFKVGDFSGLPNLKILNIKGHEAKVLPEGLFRGLDNLETLVLIGTSLQQYPKDFLVDTPNLVNCHCFRNPITTMSNEIIERLAAIDSLEILDFDSKLEPRIKARLRDIFPSNGQVDLTFH